MKSQYYTGKIPTRGGILLTNNCGTLCHSTSEGEEIEKVVNMLCEVKSAILEDDWHLNLTLEELELIHRILTKKEHVATLHLFSDVPVPKDISRGLTLSRKECLEW